MTRSLAGFLQEIHEAVEDTNFSLKMADHAITKEDITKFQEILKRIGEGTEILASKEKLEKEISENICLDILIFYKSQNEHAFKIANDLLRAINFDSIYKGQLSEMLFSLVNALQNSDTRIVEILDQKPDFAIGFKDEKDGRDLFSATAETGTHSQAALAFLKTGKFPKITKEVADFIEYIVEKLREESISDRDIFLSLIFDRNSIKKTKDYPSVASITAILGDKTLVTDGLVAEYITERKLSVIECSEIQKTIESFREDFLGLRAYGELNFITDPRPFITRLDVSAAKTAKASVPSTDKTAKAPVPSKDKVGVVASSTSVSLPSDLTVDTQGSSRGGFDAISPGGSVLSPTGGNARIKPSGCCAIL